VFIFPPLQVTVVLTASREGKGRRKQGRSAHFRALSAAAREPTRRQPRWRVEETCDHCSCSSRSLPDTVLVMQKVFPVNSILFWGYYCNFGLVCSFEIVFCIVDVKTKRKEKKREKIQ
jgi:hypothetical protein